MEQLAILLLALGLDLTFGEPPTRLHPVGWLGRLIATLIRPAPRQNRLAQLAYGTMVVAVAVGLYGIVPYLLLVRLSDWHPLAYVLAGVLLLKSTFSVRELLRAAARVKLHLLDGNLAAARQQLRALVSRDTSSLEEPQLAAAAIESLAENAVDSFIAPVFYFTLLAAAGPLAIAAAFCYRAANTLDAMIGYRGRYEYLGKAAARLDDALNLLPARLGALCIVAAAAVAGRTGQNAWRMLLRDHGKTASPNAGCPMSAAAGALGITLEKIGHYSLGDGPPPRAASIDLAVRLVLVAMLLFATLCVIILRISA